MAERGLAVFGEARRVTGRVQIRAGNGYGPFLKSSNDGGRTLESPKLGSERALISLDERDPEHVQKSDGQAVP